MEFLLEYVDKHHDHVALCIRVEGVVMLGIAELLISWG